jgi:hypothetical protein
MKTFIIEVSDDNNAEFVEHLLSQLQGVAFEKKKTLKKQSKVGHILFSKSFGMWKKRNVDARVLREQNWQRGKA